MSNVIINPLLAQPRILNLTSIQLQSSQNITVADKITPDILKSIRKRNDLPYVFLVAEESKEQVIELLSRLKSWRSTSYPYALFAVSGDYTELETADLDVIPLETMAVDEILDEINSYGRKKFSFDLETLDPRNNSPLPERVDVVIVGGGITGLYAADRLAKQQLSFCMLEKREILGGIWSMFANSTSQVNTSEAAYRVIEPRIRTNRDHSTTAEVLKDLHEISLKYSDNIHTRCEVKRIVRENNCYQVGVDHDGSNTTIVSKGVILAVNDRIGEPRRLTWENQHRYNGEVHSGISDEAGDVAWQNKKVVIVGMGAFAVENARTALENGADHVTIVCRRHGTVCPKIIDYLNFATPYDENFLHDRKSNIRNMMLWKKLYDASGATQPECWMGKIKHEGHTISVSDIWFIAHFLKKLETRTGSITGLFENGVIVDHRDRIEADIVINCVGFHRNAPAVKEICEYTQMYNNNYLDKDLMYLADAYIDDDVFNSFFGSSVLEMTKFYMDVYLDFFDKESYDAMTQLEGIYKISVEDRRWSHYIAGAEALIREYPRFYDAARNQIDKRTANFIESHDLPTYIEANKREWRDLHEQLSGRKMRESECLPYFFEKLVEKTI